MKPIEMIQQRREIEVLKMCQHPNIIKLLDIFENSDNYFIVIEYMEGKDLFDYIKKRNFLLPETRVKHLVCQLITATRYIHDFGIVHRDLKLENIMMSDVTNNAKPKLVDFGLARIISPNETANEPFGTLGYVAPEVLKKKPYSFSCDVWSIGCIMHALLTGSLPFDHGSQRETIRMTLEDVLKLDDPCWVTISSVCKDLVLKMLTKDPD
jgi:calcium-dependent protein kinase